MANDMICVCQTSWHNCRAGVTTESIRCCNGCTHEFTQGEITMTEQNETSKTPVVAAVPGGGWVATHADLWTDDGKTVDHPIVLWLVRQDGTVEPVVVLDEFGTLGNPTYRKDFVHIALPCATTTTEKEK